jgi:serine/threonine-protein kinase
LAPQTRLDYRAVPIEPGHHGRSAAINGPHTAVTATATGLERLAAALDGRYTILRTLGSGGMATVYLAHDMRHDREVAVKVLRPELTESLGRERFLREIRLAARLNHPHILPLFDSGDADGALFYVMPYVDGVSLRDRLTRERQLPIADAVRIAQEIAGALDHAHRHGIVHRDIKPENVMLHGYSPNGDASPATGWHSVVADFGIGKVIAAAAGGGDHPEHDSARDVITSMGMTLGTPAYMSPEQAVGEEVDGRSDLYSLGCVLYEMLAGEPPFTGATAQAIIAKRFVQTPADVTALREGVPRPIARTLQRVLARTPVDRPASAAELLEALREHDALGAAPASAAPAQSIAVLPVVNLSPDRDNEYFGDGIAEDIINLLSRVEGLHVAARMSAFSFKGKSEALHTVGEKLNVATVLEGSVRKSGNRLRISAQLMAVADGYQLWSERYDRELVDVFAVQDEIASAIATRLQLTFAKPIEPPKATTAEVEAYGLVVRGRALTAVRGRPILEAIECFERAIALAPDSATAHAGLGNAYRVKAQYGLGTAAECDPIAQRELTRALELDPENAEAMGHLGTFLVASHVNPDRGFALWERALALDARLSEVRALYATWGLAVLREGRDDVRAEQELRRALADDPRNPICSTIFTIGCGILGRPAEALPEARAACERDPGAFAPRYSLVWALTWARETEEGLTTAHEAMELFGRHPWLLQALTGLYMQSGNRVFAEAVHAELEARAVTSRVSFYTRAVSALYLGRVEEAFAHALRSADLKDAIGPIWFRWPDMEPLLAHPRYSEVLARLRA